MFLFLFRFISFFLILLFILNPYIESKVQIIEKPTLVIFQDNSMSISSNKDSLFYKNDYIELIESFKSKIENKYNVEFLLFMKKSGETLFHLLINFLILVQSLITLKMFFLILILVHIFYFQMEFITKDKTQNIQVKY